MDSVEGMDSIHVGWHRLRLDVERWVRGGWEWQLQSETVLSRTSRGLGEAEQSIKSFVDKSNVVIVLEWHPARIIYISSAVYVFCGEYHGTVYE